MRPLLYTAHAVPGHTVHSSTASDPFRTGCGSWTASFPTPVRYEVAVAMNMVFCPGCFGAPAVTGR